MGEINDAAAAAWRDFATDGVPSSGAHEPLKSDIRPIFDTIQSRIDMAGSAGTYIIKDTRSALYADLDHAADTYALVVADSTPAYNGYYKKAGASGGGSWSIVGTDRIGAEITARTSADTSLTTRVSTGEVNTRRARSWRSGTATVNLDGTIDLTIGNSWIEGNSGNPEGQIAAVTAGTAISGGQGYVVDMVAGSVDGSGRRIPSLVTIASGAQTGWQTAGKHILIAKDALGNYFGEYVREFEESGGNTQVTSTRSGSGTYTGIKSPLTTDGDFINFLMNNPINLTGSVVGPNQPWCDVWHMDRIWYYTGGSSTVPFTDVGEQEVVLILGTGAYVGGSSHGYQVKSFAQILTPGIKQTADGAVSGDAINVIQVSDFLNPATAGAGGYPNNAGDKLFRCNQEWIFKPGGRLTQRGYYEALVAGVVTNASYVGMLKPCLTHSAANVMTRVYLEGDWAEIDLTGTVASGNYKGKKVRYVAPTQGLYMEATAVGPWTEGPNWKTLLEGSGPKGKTYFMPHGAVPKTWALGERIHFEIEYLFGVSP